jgi:DNA polymerase-3 subunit alpha
MKPSKFSHVVALNALNRPGPMQYIPQFIRRMHGEEPVSYVHPLAEEVLGETYGNIVFQEQVMQLARTLAGFTRGESDGLRKAMGKKIVEMMESFRIKFVDGCEKNNTLSRDQAEELYAQFMKFAEYAFNKAHSVCYSVIAAQCAYLKAHYPAEFLAASMSSNMGDSDQLAIFVDDARNNFNTDIVAPDINNSESLFSVKNKKIVFALAAIKGVGIAATDQIIAERNTNGKFKNITDFAKRCAPFINKRIIESFAKVGAFDSLIPNRAQLFMNSDLIINYAANARNAGMTLSLFEDTTQDDTTENRLQKNMTAVQPWSFAERLAMEHSVLGYYISAHPLDQYKNIITRARLTTSISLQDAKDRQKVQIAANVGGYKRRMTKNGKPMMTLFASDSDGAIDAVVFGDGVASMAQILDKENLVLISGSAAVRDDSVSMFVDSVQPLANWIASVAVKLTLTVSKQEVLPDLKKLLDSLPAGHTKVVININGADRNMTIALPRNVTLTPTIANDLLALDIKSVIE